MEESEIDINLHFALYSLPLLQVLPPRVPITFSFHGLWALECQQEGVGQVGVFFRHWVEQRVYNSLGLNDHVKFLGFLPDEQLPVAYQAAELTVMPSQSLEGFGLAVLESLACGTPTLCTRIGGMPEILEPFSPNLMTSSTEATAIAERLE